MPPWRTLLVGIYDEEALAASFQLVEAAIILIARSGATKQSILPMPPHGLLRFARKDADGAAFP
jgi:hypothetical protein